MTEVQQISDATGLPLFTRRRLEKPRLEHPLASRITVAPHIDDLWRLAVRPRQQEPLRRQPIRRFLATIITRPVHEETTAARVGFVVEQLCGFAVDGEDTVFSLPKFGARRGLAAGVFGQPLDHCGLQNSPFPA